MPADPTIDELARQQGQQPAQGLPPPQPAPYGIARAQEHQQQWGMPGISQQLGDIASKGAQGARGAWDWANERARTAMTGGVSEESIRAADDLLAQMLGWGSLTGAETGALGALKMTRMIPSEKKWALHNFGSNDEWNLHSKETGKKMGELYTTFHPDQKQLHVNYMTTDYPSWEKYKLDSPVDQRSWGMGTHELQTLGPEVLREYPDIDTLKFSRIGGAFKDRPVTLTYKRVAMPDGSIGFERIETSKSGRRQPWRSPQERQQAQQAASSRIQAARDEPDQPRVTVPPLTEAEEQFLRNLSGR